MSEVEKIYIENAKRGVEQKSAKFAERASPYIQLNILASRLYRMRKSQRGLKGARAWDEWRRIQKRLLALAGLVAGQD
jgi:hypothetical protein